MEPPQRLLSSNADSSIVKIALTHDTTYYIHYTYFGGVTCPTCNMVDTIVLKYVPDFNHTLSQSIQKYASILVL
ncbi:MAG: hypothetical protein IPK03_05340 [Bacteroidetes bacterium]|nr:hypothetical protein [Bacteroidota bacterium]